MFDRDTGFDYVGSTCMGKRKILYGIGINDVELPTKIQLKDGRVVHCPIYEKWRSIVYRSTPQWWEKHPHYTGTSICEEWKKFSAFREWMLQQKWKGKQIDKDIIDPYSKEYNPNTCRFVPKEINVLMTERQNYRGNFPLGVTYDSSAGKKKYQAQCNIDGRKSKKLGRFETPMEAHRAYQQAKATEIIRVASLYYDSGEIEGDVYISLIQRANKVFNEYEKGEETFSIHHY